MIHLNIITYTIYLFVCAIITVFVGKNLHRNGFYLIVDLFEDITFSKTINNILLMGYYLVNIGNIAIAITSFKEITSFMMLLETLVNKTSIILFILGLLHFNNILLLHLLSKNKHKLYKYFITNK